MNIGYSSSIQESASFDENGNGFESINNINSLMLAAGIKLYLREIEVESVSPSLSFSIAKTFGSRTNENHPLPFVPPPPGNINDNFDEFQNELISPLAFNLGLEAEYFINSSFSINTGISFVYNIITATREITQPGNSQTTEVTDNDFLTRAVLGLHLYF